MTSVAIKYHLSFVISNLSFVIGFKVDTEVQHCVSRGWEGTLASALQ